jgi:hypothetical protein
MQVLVNFVPKLGEIYTRLGATPFLFTGSTTATEPFPIDTPIYTLEGETAVCVAVFRFNSQAEIGLNSINGLNVFTPLSTVNYSGMGTISVTASKEAPASLFMTNKSADTKWVGTSNWVYGLQSLNATPDYFPCDSGRVTRATLLTMWVMNKDVITSGTDSEYFLIMGALSSPSFGLFIRQFDDTLQFSITASSGGTLISYASSSCFTQGQWLFVAFWCDFEKGNRGHYIYDDTAKTETILVATVGKTLNFLRSCGATTIGGRRRYDAGGLGWYMDSSDAFHGHFDYFTMWNKLYTNNTSNVTLIRKIRDVHKAP